MTGSALPGQVSQGAVAGSLKLSVLFTLSILNKGHRRRQGQTHTHFGRAVWFEGVSMNLSCQSLGEEKFKRFGRNVKCVGRRTWSEHLLEFQGLARPDAREGATHVTVYAGLGHKQLPYGSIGYNSFIASLYSVNINRL